MINGSPTDPNAADFKAGAHSVLDSSGYKVAAEYDTPDWSPDKAQAWMEGQISAVKGNLVGVYAANDGTAGGAIAALKGGGVTPLPPVTGQDAELAAIQRILAGDQAMTIYKPIKPEATAAAKAALALANKQKPPSTDGLQGRPVHDPQPDRGHQGQRQGHRRQGRHLQGRTNLHWLFREGVQRCRLQLSSDIDVPAGGWSATRPQGHPAYRTHPED